MSIVQLRFGRTARNVERASTRQGLVSSSRFQAALQLVQRQTPAATYCAACAAPIDFGAVWRGDEAFCSFECSFEGRRPA